MSETVEAKNSGLAIAGMVLGIIGAVFAFIPIINNIAFFIGILAVIFGVIALIKKSKKGTAIAAIATGVAAIVITLIMQAAASAVIDEVSDGLDKMSGGKTSEVLQQDFNVEFGNFEVTESEYGFTNTKLVVKVTNISDEKLSGSIHIEAIDTEGSRIEEGYIYINDLSAGQSQEFEEFTYIESSKLEAMKTATFNVVEASVY